MIFLLVFALLLQDVMGSQTHVWKSGNVSYTFSMNGKEECYGSFDLLVDFNAGNVSFPNIITFENYIFEPNCYYNMSWIAFENDLETTFIECPSWITRCVTSFPNCQLKVYILLDSDNFVLLLDDLTYINDGTMFLSNGSIPNANNQCHRSIGYSPFGNASVQFCYSGLQQVEIEDANEDVCNKFESTGFITDVSSYKKCMYNVEYVFLTDRIYINTTSLLSSPCNIGFYIDNEPFGCGINNFCEWKIPEADDFQYEFILYGSYTWTITIGELVRRNGVLIHDIKIPYNRENPCWTRSGLAINDMNGQGPYVAAKYNFSFCCKNFDSVSSTTLMQTTLSDTTFLSTIPIGTPSSLTTSSPIYYFDGTLCSSDTSKAWLDIIFVVDVATSMSSKSLMQLSGEIATTLQKFTFSKNGDHTTRAGIIIYGSNFTTLFELNNVTNFVAFEKVLLSLSKYYDSRDYGSNVYGALDAAYRLLQIQKSHRLPVIVLVSATYNASGFKGTSELSKSIKGNGTNIVGINFSPENPDLTKALQNIVSPGYYYVSTQQDLYVNLGYAFTQLNCVCPSGSKQFRLFNPSFNNYTNFADCLYGVIGDTEPSIANMLCNSDNGILVSLPNPQIFDFITDNIIPYDLLGVKKFSIGLHKSDFDGLWKWWNYDGSETLKGDYPNMSTNPAPTDNYGYMWNYNGFKWKLQTGNDIPLPYICQKRACDAENFCDSLKNN